MLNIIEQQEIQHHWTPQNPPFLGLTLTDREVQPESNTSKKVGPELRPRPPCQIPIIRTWTLGFKQENSSTTLKTPAHGSPLYKKRPCLRTSLWLRGTFLDVQSNLYPLNHWCTWTLGEHDMDQNLKKNTLLRVIPTMTCWVEVVRWGLSLRIWWEEWRIWEHWFQVSLA